MAKIVLVILTVVFACSAYAEDKEDTQKLKARIAKEQAIKRDNAIAYGMWYGSATNLSPLTITTQGGSNAKD